MDAFADNLPECLPLLLTNFGERLGECGQDLTGKPPPRVLFCDSNNPSIF